MKRPASPGERAMRSVPRQMVARSPHVPSPGGEVPGAEGPGFLPAHPPMMPTQRRQPLRARQSCHDSWMDLALPVGAQARSPPRHRPLAPPARAALGSPLRDTKLARPSRRLRGTSPRGRGTVAHSQSPAHVTGLPRGRDSRLVVPIPRPAPFTSTTFWLGVVKRPEGQKEAQPA